METKIDTASPTITNHSFSIMENVSTGTIVGVVNATDNDRITNYAITAGNTSNTFAISNNGLLTTANTIDYESISNYSLTIVVSDEGGETASNTTTVRVIDLDDTPPTITNHSFSIMENVSAGTIVGVVSATDNDRITNYAITAGNTSNTFAISNNGLLTTANTIDYESISNYSLTIEVVDGAGNTASNTVTVTIADAAIVPRITTLTPTGVHAVDAILQGNLTDLGEDSDGNMRAGEYGFIYSTNASNQTTLVIGASGVEKTNLGSRNTIGQFSNMLIGIEEDTIYYYRAYAINDIGTTLGEVRSFTTGILHATFSLNGATDGEQSGIIYPGGSHTYNVFLSNTHAYNISIDAASNVSDSLITYEATNTNELYIQSGPFTITPNAPGLSNFTLTFSGADNGSRYLLLPLATTNHRLVLSNSNVGPENYTLTLGEETNTSGEPIGRVLIDGTPMGFFTNNDPVFYWFHLPPNRSFLDSAGRGINMPNCGVRIDNETLSYGEVIFGAGNNFPSYEALGNSLTTGSRYFIVRIYRGALYDYTRCQLRFRVR